MDVCSILHLDNGCVVDTALHILSKMRPKYPEKARCELAYAIWEALNRQGTPRPPHQITSICNVPPSSILKMEKIYGVQSSYCNPSHYMDTACCLLNIPFHLARLAKELLSQVEQRYYGRSPEALIAGSILSLVEKIRGSSMYLHSSSDYLDHININMLACQFNTTARTVRAVLRLFPSYRLAGSGARFKITFKKES